MPQTRSPSSPPMMRALILVACLTFTAALPHRHLLDNITVSLDGRNTVVTLDPAAASNIDFSTAVPTPLPSPPKLPGGISISSLTPAEEFSTLNRLEKVVSGDSGYP